MSSRLQVLIADDEALARHLVREYLATHADIDIIAECENGSQAAAKIEALQPALVFLDIHMPRLNGLEVLEMTGRRDGVIFTTAYDQYAQKAFDLHAVDYLLKPFSKARFDEALSRARARMGQGSEGLEKLLAQAPLKLERILIRDREQTHVIAVASIDYVEAQGDYVAIHAEGRKHLKAQALTDLETQLDPRVFVRIHRSFIVNLTQLQGIERAGAEGHAARLRCGKSLPISRSGHERLKAAM